MGNLNPLQLLVALKSSNPKSVVMSIINNNFPNDPAMKQLVQMATNNDVQGLSNYAQQLLSKHGLNLNSEMNTLMNAVNNM